MFEILQYWCFGEEGRLQKYIVGGVTWNLWLLFCLWDVYFRSGLMHWFLLCLFVKSCTYTQGYIWNNARLFLLATREIRLTEKHLLNVCNSWAPSWFSVKSIYKLWFVLQSNLRAEEKCVKLPRLFLRHYITHGLICKCLCCFELYRK